MRTVLWASGLPLKLGDQSCPADFVASCTNDTGGFPTAAGSRLQPGGSELEEQNGECQLPIPAALRQTVYRAKRTDQTLLGEMTRTRLYLSRPSVSTLSCFRGHKPPPERIPDQSGLIAQAKFAHEVRPMALGSADADG